jgi:uncharacterized protein
MGLKRDEAIALLKKYISNDRMINHSLASEAVMRAIARRLCEDEEQWGMAGLLHDLDIELVEGDLKRHALEAEKILAEHGVDPEIIDAIRMHNELATGKARHTPFQHALAAGETITGLIVATAMVYPDKKLSSVKVKSVIKRMKEKAFAASVNRDNIMECEKLGIDIQEFAEISLTAMNGLSDTMGL